MNKHRAKGDINNNDVLQDAERIRMTVENYVNEMQVLGTFILNII